jgi:vancomycin resistance protein YoaR
MTTLTLPRRLIRPAGSHPARSALVGFSATLLAGLLLLAAASIAIGVVAGSRVLSGVSVGDVSVAGLDRAAVADRLQAQLPAVDTGEATVRVGETQLTVPFSELGRRYELERMADAALAVGRGADPITDAIARLRTVVHPTSVPVIVHAYDADALAAAAGGIAREVSDHPTEARVVADDGRFTVNAGSDGRVLGPADISTALAAALEGTDPADVAVSLTAATVRPVVDTAAAERAAAAATSMAADLELTIPGADAEESQAISAETIASAISFGPQAADPYAARIDEAAITAAVKALAKDVNRAPVNAQIAVAAGGGLGGVIPGQEGRKVDVKATTSAVLGALRERAGGGAIGSLGMAVSATEPTLTTAEAEAVRPQMKMISTWTTHYVPGESNGFGANINIPAVDIDGHNLAPGEWFSFWDAVGPISFERGYTYGGAIINGRSQPTGALAGGICSTSTTIFNAALRAGLEMGIRLNHHYYIDRYPIGLDATVSIIDGWTQDMTFRNDTDNPIVIRGFGGNGSVTFQIWSVPLDREVVITDPVTSNHRGAIDTTVVDSSMAPGTSRRVEFPHDGLNVSRTRFVYDGNGNLIHRNDYFSPYAPVNGVVAVGPSGSARSSADRGDDDEGETAGGGGIGDAPPPGETP